MSAAPMATSHATVFGLGGGNSLQASQIRRPAIESDQRVMTVHRNAVTRYLPTLRSFPPMDRRSRVSQLVFCFGSGAAASASVTRVRAPMKAEVPRMGGFIAARPRKWPLA
jgi:hypothetical protein